MQKSEFTVKNVTEEIVWRQVKRCMESLSMCTCDKCAADVTAIALNNLQPHYVVTELGENLVLAGALSAQSEADTLTAVMSAALMVSKSPKHG